VTSTLHKIQRRFVQQVLIIGSGLVLSSILAILIFFLFRDLVPRAVFLAF